MSSLGLVERVRGWFGARASETHRDFGGSGRWGLGPTTTDVAMALAGAAAAAEAGRPDLAAHEPWTDDATPESYPSTAPADDGHLPPASGKLPSEPVDPVWLRTLDDLPHRIGESVARHATGAPSMEAIERELEGHRQTTRDIRDAVRRLPELAGDQTQLARETNRILERQTAVLASMFDGITALRAALRTVEETSRRQVLAIAQLEESHREVLREYQALLMKSHTRVARLAAVGLILAAWALGGAAYVAYLVMVAP
jgi:hypothetical protein